MTPRETSAQSNHINGDTKAHIVTSRHSSSIGYRNLSVYGFSRPTDYQKTFSNYPLAICQRYLSAWCSREKSSRKCILQDFEGLVHGGELLLVLGRPGSGCTTLLKTLAGDTHGLQVDKAASLSYEGTRDHLANSHSSVID